MGNNLSAENTSPMPPMDPNPPQEGDRQRMDVPAANTDGQLAGKNGLDTLFNEHWRNLGRPTL